MPDFTVVTVTATYERAPGIPSTGYVLFTPSAELVNNSNWHAFSKAPFKCHLQNGILTAPLIALDDSTTIPTGQTWLALPFIDDEFLVPFQFSLSTSQAPTVALNSLTPAVPATPAMASYALQSALATETSRATGVEATISANLARMISTPWAAATPYLVGQFVSNGTGLYEAPSGGVPARSTFTSSDWIHLADLAVAGAPTMTPIAAVTTAGALAINKLTPVNAVSAPLTMTLPTGQPTGTWAAIQKTDTSTNAVTVSGSIRGASTSITLALLNETVWLAVDAAGSWWPLASHKTLGSLDGRYSKTLAAVSVATAASPFSAALGTAILADATAGALTIKLPAVSAGGTVSVRKVDSSGNPVIVQTAGGTQLRYFAIQNQAYTFNCDGTVWSPSSPAFTGNGTSAPVGPLDLGTQLSTAVFTTGNTPEAAFYIKNQLTTFGSDLVILAQGAADIHFARTVGGTGIIISEGLSWGFRGATSQDFLGTTNQLLLRLNDASAAVASLGLAVPNTASLAVGIATITAASGAALDIRGNTTGTRILNAAFTQANLAITDAGVATFIGNIIAPSIGTLTSSQFRFLDHTSAAIITIPDTGAVTFARNVALQSAGSLSIGNAIISSTNGANLDLQGNTTGTRILNNAFSAVNVGITDAGQVKIRGGLSMWGATVPTSQPAAITAPTGGATIDSQARTAINSILTAIGAAAGGVGITA